MYPSKVILLAVVLVTLHAGCSALTHLNTEADFDEALKSSQPVVVFYTASWCGQCKRLHPAIEAMQKQFKNLDFYAVDVDMNYKTAENQGIVVLPTVKLYYNGREVSSVQGASEEKIRRMLEYL